MTSDYRYAIVWVYIYLQSPPWGFTYSRHLYHTLPPAAVLHLLFSPVCSRRDVFKISLLSVVAVISTTPWDSYLIRKNIWSYPPSSVLGTLFSIPTEEFFFFIIQTYITSTLYLLLAKPIVHPVFLNPHAQHRAIQLGVCFFAAVTGIGVWMVKQGHELLYLGLILVWAGPILILLTALSGSHIGALPFRLTFISIGVPTIYLWFVDTLALGDGTWIIEKGTKMDWQLWGDLDIEEAVFFLVTNTLVVFGLITCDKAFAIMDAFPEVFPPFRLIPSFKATLHALSLHPSQYDTQRLDYLQDAYRILENKSRSFCLASIVFPDRCRLYLFSIYAFCRIVDDLVDDTPDLGAAQKTLQVTRKYLDFIYSESNAKSDHGMEDIPPQARAAFSLLPMMRSFIPVKPFLDLLAGFDSDLAFLKATSDPASLPIQTEADLITYCERVASTVAHMFVHTTWHCEPSDMSNYTEKERAWILGRATQMGIALQLVNIARDIVEDAQNGRTYIPVSWFRDAGELDNLETLLHDPQDSKLDGMLSRYALRLVCMANAHYAEARPGLEHVPQQCRKGARLAIEVYMDIGREIGRRHGDVRTRVVVDRWTKLCTTFRVLYS